MRTNIEIDDDLMREAMAAMGASTKREAVEAALQRVVALKRQGDALMALRGIGWFGNLDEMRLDCTSSSIRAYS